MTSNPLTQQLLNAWKANNEISLKLISSIPPKGFSSVPYGSKGRTVLEQFVHMNNVRTGWLFYNKTGKRPTGGGAKGKKLTKTELKKMFTGSAKDVSKFINECAEGKTKPKMFGGQIVKWIGYLISHESHHRGSILLTLKQSGIKIPDKISLDGLWFTWMKAN